jgi:hypothetical protein
MTTGEPTTRVTFESGADQGIPVEHESGAEHQVVGG